MKRPLVISAFIFCLGILAAPKIKAAFAVIYILAVIFMILCSASLRKGLRFDVFLCCLIFLSSAALWKNSQVLPRCHILRFVSYKNNRAYTVKGMVENRPLFKKNTISFIFKAREVQFDNLKYDTCGNILVYVRARKDLPCALARLKDLHYGDEVILSGKIHRPFGFGGSRRKSYRDYLYNQGIYCVMHVKTATSVIGLKRNNGLALKRLALWLKGGMEDIIFKRLSFIPACIMDAMILGEKRNIPLPIRNSMMRTGTVHILVVSGFHVALVSFIIILSLKLARVPRLLRFFIAVPLIIIYCLVAGASTPAVRATIMAIIFMLASSFRREPDIYNSLALAAIFILAVKPGQLFDIGFQLSFVSVISIVYLYPKLKFFIPAGILKIKYIQFLAKGCLVSLSAWLGTAGLVAYYFRIVSPVTVLANIFIVPLASLITLCGFSLIVMEFICPVLSPLFASSSEFAVSLLLNINAFLVQLPGAYFYLS